MLRKFYFAFILGLFSITQLIGHCQMPCGIYHDEMVFDQIDQFIETTVKAISVLEENSFSSVQDKNVFIRWIMQKEKSCDEMAHLITTYFLQQKIKPGEEDTTKRVLSAHQLLFYLVQIKQTVDLKVVNDFYEEWERFKLMFHIEGYKCKVSQSKLKKWAQKSNQSNQNSEGESHHHEDSNELEHHHDHPHPHDEYHH